MMSSLDCGSTGSVARLYLWMLIFLFKKYKGHIYLKYWKSGLWCSFSVKRLKVRDELNPRPGKLAWEISGSYHWSLHWGKQPQVWIPFRRNSSFKIKIFIQYWCKVTVRSVYHKSRRCRNISPDRTTALKGQLDSVSKSKEMVKCIHQMSPNWYEIIIRSLTFPIFNLQWNELRNISKSYLDQTTSKEVRPAVAKLLHLSRSALGNAGWLTVSDDVF